jgi:D-alanyl-D-alanine carboxypeptidase (penicillin-binding protein 5/6)
MKNVKKILLFTLTTLLLLFNLSNAAGTTVNLSPAQDASDGHASPKRLIIPPAPKLQAKGYVLMDADSGQVLADKAMNTRMQPASLTKMMTLYIIANALRNGQIAVSDLVHISEKAWRTGGSKMFVRAGSNVSVKNLIQGIVVDSGNDACTAMAEYIAGTEEAFAALMNQMAQSLGMKNTHYTDSTGLPHANHYSTPYDMAILARAIIKDFPEYYGWYQQKWFTYNKIKQPNRNRLLWRDPSVDGLKTGHTNAAGYCLVASAKRNNMRLITVAMGTPTDEARHSENEALLNYGFRFFKTHHLFDANQPIAQARIWLGQKKTVDLGVAKDLYVTIPTSLWQTVKAQTSITAVIKAPVTQKQPLGKLKIYIGNKNIQSIPLIALQNNPKGGLWTRFKDTILLLIRKS